MYARPQQLRHALLRIAFKRRLNDGSFLHKDNGARWSMLVIDATCMDHQAMGRWGGISRSVDLCGYAAADPNRPTEDNQISFEPLLSRHTRPCLACPGSKISESRESRRIATLKEVQKILEKDAIQGQRYWKERVADACHP